MRRFTCMTQQEVLSRDTSRLRRDSASPDTSAPQRSWKDLCDQLYLSSPAWWDEPQVEIWKCKPRETPLASAPSPLISQVSLQTPSIDEQRPWAIARGAAARPGDRYRVSRSFRPTTASWGFEFKEACCAGSLTGRGKKCCKKQNVCTGNRHKMHHENRRIISPCSS